MYTEVQLSANMADEIWLTFGRIAIEIDGFIPVNCEENISSLLFIYINKYITDC